MNHRDHFVAKLVLGAGPMGDGGNLQPVNFVENPVDRGVGDEVVEVVFLGCLTCSFVDEGARAGEGVVDVAD